MPQCGRLATLCCGSLTPFPIQLVMTSPGKALALKSWDRAEDETLLSLVREAEPVVNWKTIAQTLPGRDEYQCRRHWSEVLDPSIKKGPWSREEERLLAQAHEEIGDSWTEISKRIVGRTDKQCQTHWIKILSAASTKHGVSELSENEV